MCVYTFVFMHVCVCYTCVHAELIVLIVTSGLTLFPHHTRSTLKLKLKFSVRYTTGGLRGIGVAPPHLPRGGQHHQACGDHRGVCARLPQPTLHTGVCVCVCVCVCGVNSDVSNTLHDTILNQVHTHTHTEHRGLGNSDRGRVRLLARQVLLQVKVQLPLQLVCHVVGDTIRR